MTRQRAVVMYFTAANCSVCRRMTPHVQATANQFRDRVDLVEFDVAADPVRVGEHAVRAVPTLIALHNGVVVGRAVGAQRMEALAALFAGAATGEVGFIPLSTTERMMRLVAAASVGVIAALAVQPLLLIAAVGPVARPADRARISTALFAPGCVLRLDASADAPSLCVLARNEDRSLKYRANPPDRTPGISAFWDRVPFRGR